MLTYGSYLGKDERLPSAALWTSSLDTLIALLAGFAIFPAVFAMGFQPGAGPGLTFITLPAVFAKMPAGTVFSFLFFLLLFFAAVSSSMSLLEAATAFAMEKFKMKRTDAVCVMGIIIILLGGYSAIALAGYNVFEGPVEKIEVEGVNKVVIAAGAEKVVVEGLEKIVVKPMNHPAISGRDFFDAVDYFCNNVLLPLGSLFLCLFVGWFWSGPACKELTNDGKHSYSWLNMWMFCVKILAPLGILFIFLDGTGLLAKLL